jgi:hypothetical protein
MDAKNYEGTELHAAGFAATVERGRRHFQIKFGRHGLLIISATPSKNYARNDNRSLLRRLIKRECEVTGRRP